MQLLFLLCTMLITISEAFSQTLHGVPPSTSFKRKTSRFTHRLRYPLSRYVLSDLNNPLSLVPLTHETSQYEALNFIPLRHHHIKPHKYKKNYFSRKGDVNEKLKGQFLRNNCEFFKSTVFKPPECFEINQFPRSGFRRFRNFMGLRKDCDSKLYSPKKRGRQCLPSAYVPFNYENSRFGQRKLVKRLKKKHKRFSNFKKQCLPDADVETESSASKTNATRVSACDEKVETTADSDDFIGEKSEVESPQDFSVNAKSNTLTPLPREDTLTHTAHKFECSDDPKRCDLSPFESDNPLPNLRQKEEVSEIRDESKSSVKENLAEDISKLKHMISDVENAIKERKKAPILRTKEEKEKTEKEATQKVVVNVTLDNLSLKEKIDKLAIPVLSQISEDLAKNKTIMYENQTTVTSISSNASNATSNATGGTADQTKNGRCNPDGTWSSRAMGMDLTFTMQPHMMIKVTVKGNSESKINEKWSLQGLTLSKRGGPFIFAGLHPQKKKVVSFLGQCKMSKEEDFIFGIWTLFTYSRKYTDLWQSVETKLDVLTKKDYSSGKKKKKKEKEKEKKELKT